MAHPDWYEQAAAALAAGQTQAQVAEACGTSERTLRRALASPDGELRGMVAQAKAQAAQETGEDIAALREKAFTVLHAALDKNDTATARALIARLVAPVESAPPPEPEPEEEATADDACTELAHALPDCAELARVGGLSPGTVEVLRQACRDFADCDLKPREPEPLDDAADALETAITQQPAGAAKQSAPPPPPPAQQQPGPGGAVVIPIRPA